MTARLEPPVSPEAAPFWDATRQRQLMLQWCRACDLPVHHPRVLCPRCGGTDLDWREAAGRGRVHAFTVLHRPGNPTMAERVPYVVALIDLEEGARMMSNVVGCEPGRVAVGMPVRVGWEDLPDGRALPVFEPAGEAAGD
ncbi:MAG TPA: Zn-ribbon domain-containing OB-fold protein [Acidimicrobiales bacterium]|nr:Zn-ribbon domain-containing OB-fold protein [Acidimicrobiales bacterium]